MLKETGTSGGDLGLGADVALALGFRSWPCCRFTALRRGIRDKGSKTGWLVTPAVGLGVEFGEQGSALGSVTGPALGSAAGAGVVCPTASSAVQFAVGSAGRSAVGRDVACGVGTVVAVSVCLGVESGVH